MTIKFKKKQIMEIVTLVILLIASCLFRDFSNILLFTMIFTPICAVELIDCIKRQNYLFFCFFGMTLEIFFAMLLNFFVICGEETSWRLLYNSTELNQKSLQYIFASLVLFLILYILLLSNRGDFETNVLSSCNFYISKINLLGFEILFGIILIYYILKIRTFTFRSYSANQSLVIIILFRACFLIGLILFYKFKKDRLLLIELVIGTCIALLLGLVTGYRYILFETVILFIFLHLSRIKKIKAKNIIILVILLLSFYLAMVIVKANLTKGDWTIQLFSHERNLFYSLNAIIKNMGTTYESTYLSTVKNILPKFITGSKDMNTGGILMKYISPTIQSETGINMGGFYLTEAYANFHIVGIYLVSFIFAIMLIIIERCKHKIFKTRYGSRVFCIFYLILISQTNNMVYYGSSNYVKILVYIMLLAVVLVVPVSFFRGNN